MKTIIIYKRGGWEVCDEDGNVLRRVRLWAEAMLIRAVRESA